MQNLETLNIAKHWIAIASKTVTGQYGSSTVLKQVTNHLDQQCKFLGVHTALCAVVEHWQLNSVVPKLGDC